MKRQILLASLLILSGCGVWSSTIRSDIVDYSGAIGETTDKNLLINVLEARDNSPVHYVEMPKITGSLQATASLAGTAEFLPINAGTVGGVLNQSATPTVSVQSSPTFEVDNLDTKEFSTGVTSQIDPKQIKYWYDKGLDNRILLLLFFSSLQVQYQECVPPDDTDKPLLEQQKEYDACKKSYGTPATECDPSDKDCQAAYETSYENAIADCNAAAEAATKGEKTVTAINKAKKAALDKCLKKRVNVAQSIDIRNDPRRAAIFLKPCQTQSGLGKCPGIIPFGEYLTVVNNIASRFVVQTYGERSLLGAKVAIAPKDLAKFDPAKYDVEYLSDAKPEKGSKGKPSLYNIYSASSDKKIAICFGERPLTKRGSGLSGNCPESTVTDQTKSNPPDDPTTDRVLPEGAFCDNTSRLDHHSYCAIYAGFLGYLNGASDKATAKSTAVKELGRHYSLTVRIRSAGEIVRYLGDLLYYQGMVAQDCDHNIPVTLSYKGSCKESGAKPCADMACWANNDGVLFYLNLPGTSPRFTVDYRNKEYSLGEGPVPIDHSLEVLAVTSLSINLNKSSTDIHPTPTIQVIP